MHTISETLRKIGFDKLVHKIRQVGLPDRIRAINTKESKRERQGTFDRAALVPYFTNDVRELSEMIDRDLNTEWGIE